ncbi:MULTISPECIES: cytidine deaminase [Pseudovibrio]|uniref:cytidine deaminase n=1 Tax=Stappiaceae TaxID=2821832 RepID=UPI00236716DA|nr:MULTISPECIES: cytidine deaminase [Pseudovibrio]MDD7910058.1 cytidine deaminase [Pseudovibrio exalbescens]MDX5592341.1 cytidine deaminase [Pseudovibrio sp. SPO723]
MSAFEKLFDEAKAAHATAYAPYSNFKVGAALLTEDGKVVSGCNVENAAYPEGTCAEAGAIAAMIRGGSTRIKEVVVLADAALCTPCGGCRQKLKEFADGDVQVHVANLEGLRKTFKVSELLPAGFELVSSE